jgi:hypothetical protein
MSTTVLPTISDSILGSLSLISAKHIRRYLGRLSEDEYVLVLLTVAGAFLIQQVNVSLTISSHIQVGMYSTIESEEDLKYASIRKRTGHYMLALTTPRSSTYWPKPEILLQSKLALPRPNSG